MNIGYVHIENGIPVTSKRNHTPPNMITKCPKDDKNDYITDIDVLDIDTNLRTAKFNQTKYDQKESNRVTLEAEIQAKVNLEAQEKTAVDAIDVDNMVDDLTKTELKKVLKWLIKRAG